MNSLFISFDLGTKSSGNIVSTNELNFLESISDNVIVLGYADISPSVYGLPDNPFLIDYLTLNRVSQLDLSNIDFCHFYAGPFTNTIRYLKAKVKGVKISLTLAVHDRFESINEFANLGYQYPFNVVKDDKLWKIFNGAPYEADMVIVQGTVPKMFLINEGVKEGKIRIVPHGIDIPDSSIKSIDTDVFRVGYLGATGPDKGIRYLVEAWSSLNYNDSILDFAGANSIELGPFINKYAINGKFNLIGYVQDVADFYNNISVYVQPSVTEGFGIEVAEAMSYGRPVIVSRGAGACDLIEDGVNGFVVDKRDVKGIADKIDWFKKHPQELYIMSGRARSVAKKYSWDKIKEIYISVWKELSVGMVKEGIVKIVKEVKKLHMAVCTLCTSEIEDFAKHTTLNIKHYCQIHGYDYIEINDKNTDIRNNISPLHPYLNWCKVSLLYDTLITNKYDWVFWLDCDAVFTNKDIKLEDIINTVNSESMVGSDDTEIIVTKEESGCCVISTGAMLIRNSEWSKNFLKAWYDKGELPNAQWRDQDTFHYFYYNDEKVRKKVKVIRQKVMNSFADIFTDNDFIIHYAGRERTPLKRFAYYRDQNYVSKRDEIPFLLNELGLNGDGIEIGVQRGLYAEIVLRNSSLKKLYLCDPWKQIDTNIYSDVANINDEEQEKILKEMINRVFKYNYSRDRINILRMTSDQAIESKLFKDKQLDFVYIDANHKYEYILKDIEMWYPKVKNGGIIAGHDYLDGEIMEGSFGVKSAVTDFFGNNKNNERIYITDENWPSWYVIKNNKE